MITKNVCAFMAQFEKNLNNGMSLENAIEIACDFGKANELGNEFENEGEFDF